MKANLIILKMHYDMAVINYIKIISVKQKINFSSAQDRTCVINTILGVVCHKKLHVPFFAALN